MNIERAIEELTEEINFNSFEEEINQLDEMDFSSMTITEAFNSIKASNKLETLANKIEGKTKHKNNETADKLVKELRLIAGKYKSAESGNGNKAEFKQINRAAKQLMKKLNGPRNEKIFVGAGLTGLAIIASKLIKKLGDIGTSMGA